jgi:hypothetical protein
MMDGLVGRDLELGPTAPFGHAAEPFRLMRPGLFMVRSSVRYADYPNAPMLQECRLIGSVRLEAMITIARYGRTTRPHP